MHHRRTASVVRSATSSSARRSRLRRIDGVEVCSWSAVQTATSAAGAVEAELGPLDDEAAFELGDAGEHRQNELRHRVAVRTKIDPLRGRDEPHTVLLKLADVCEQVEGGTAEAIQLPAQDRVDLVASGSF